MHLLDENIAVNDGISVAATYRTAAAVNGAAVDMAKYHNFAGIITVTGATQWQGALTAVIAEGTTSTQFSTSYLATKTIATATTNQIEVIEVSGDQMSDGYRYLRMEITPASGTGNLFAAVNTRFNPRYAAISQ